MLARVEFHCWIERERETRSDRLEHVQCHSFFLSRLLPVWHIRLDLLARIFDAAWFFLANNASCVRTRNSFVASTRKLQTFLTGAPKFGKSLLRRPHRIMCELRATRPFFVCPRDSEMFVWVYVRVYVVVAQYVCVCSLVSVVNHVLDAMSLLWARKTFFTFVNFGWEHILYSEWVFCCCVSVHVCAYVSSDSQVDINAKWQPTGGSILQAYSAASITSLMGVTPSSFYGTFQCIHLTEVMNFYTCLCVYYLLALFTHAKYLTCTYVARGVDDTAYSQYSLVEPQVFELTNTLQGWKIAAISGYLNITSWYFVWRLFGVCGALY